MDFMKGAKKYVMFLDTSVWSWCFVVYQRKKRWQLSENYKHFKNSQFVKMSK